MYNELQVLRIFPNPTGAIRDCFTSCGKQLEYCLEDKLKPSLSGVNFIKLECQRNVKTIWNVNGM